MRRNIEESAAKCLSLSMQRGIYMSRRKKKKKGMGKIVFLCLLIAVCLVILAGMVKGSFLKGTITDGIKSAVTRKVTETVMEQAVQKALESSGDPQAAARAKEIVNSMEETDKQEAEAIIEKYADSETLSDCMEIVGDGINSESIAQVQEYLQESVSDEDIQKLQELYEKYGGTMP